ncbi:glycoside hydrolase superfamily [Penicillium angulare]|uniref:Beta-mannosidase A n=1 Tax=Penicillium angulare TaxID=116970 RepID=A0A9W9G7X9_9EURO|nr:glycoside hydrolase superfamily [Penicillium angulare]
MASLPWAVVLGFALSVAGEFPMSSSGGSVLNLGGETWKATSSNRSIHIPATVPGMIQTDLFQAGVIDDPYYSNNFNYTRWISDDSWVYSREIPPASAEGKKWSDFKKVYLVFDGLDTAAHIRINGEEVGFANNQFRQWTFDVSDKMGDSINLDIEFESAIKYALDVFESIGASYTVFTNYFWEYPEGREYIRKIQSDFGWDWGPHFSPSGIYRDAYLVGLDDGIYITNTFIDIFKDGQRPNTIPEQTSPWNVNISMDYLSAGSFSDVTIKSKVAGYAHETTVNATPSPGHGTVNVMFNMSDSQVERWWPHELGNPKLYDLDVELQTGKVENGNSPAIHFQKRVGFRTIVLNLEPYSDRYGSNFHFEVNGKPFNAKGSNMVPVDAFESRIDDEWYKRLLKSCVASNFNLLRLWASGNYYRDSFYELADELGIFLWSELQFSDNYYPTTPDFLENVRQEVLYQVRRLNRHPSMAVWTGGNELEGYNLDMLAYNETWGQDFFKNYTKLIDTIWPEVYKNTRSVSWLQASDSHGYSYYNPDTGTWLNRYGDVTRDYPSPYFGPAELYNLDTDQAFNHSKLPASRFMVEFGMWSYDSLESYQTVLPDSEIHPKSPIIIQRCYDDGPDTVNILDNAVATYYAYPNRSDSLVQFDQMSWTTQIYQAEHIKNQIESYR